MQTLPHSPTTAKWNGPGKSDKARELRRRIDDSLDTLSKAVDAEDVSQLFEDILSLVVALSYLPGDTVVEKPIIKWTVILEFKCAQRMGNAFDRV